jgi:hypothetical protein
VVLVLAGLVIVLTAILPVPLGLSNDPVDSSTPEAPTAALPPAGVAPSNPAAAVPSRAPSVVPPLDVVPYQPGRSPAATAKLRFADPLDDNGRWRDTRDVLDFSDCQVAGLLRPSRLGFGDSACPGPDIDVADPFSLTVSVDLRSAASCAGIWLHTDGARHGDLVRICAEGVQLVADRTDKRVLETLRPGRPLPVRTTMRIRLAVAGGRITVTRDDERLGALRLPADGPRQGGVLLGISVPTLSLSPPYEVTYSRLVIRES